ncbi:MAG: hypothetical protein N3H32_01835, partial [Nitrososphaeria archaeon]|nr:hypothetical protein [Nitrososphaeria archaeon]
VLRERVIVDPNAIEEAALETSVVMGWGTDDELAAIQKNTPGLLPIEVFEEIVEVSRSVASKLRRTLRESIGDRWTEPATG